MESTNLPAAAAAGALGSIKGKKVKKKRNTVSERRRKDDLRFMGLEISYSDKVGLIYSQARRAVQTPGAQ